MAKKKTPVPQCDSVFFHEYEGTTHHAITSARTERPETGTRCKTAKPGEKCSGGHRCTKPHRHPGDCDYGDVTRPARKAKARK